MKKEAQPKDVNGLSPLKLRNIMAYGAGDFGFAVIIHMSGLFLLFFYTDVFGISAAAAGTIFMIARVWDAVNDPVLGYISDRTQTRWGKYRPYLLFGVIPLALFNMLLFTTPDFGDTGKFVWALIIYIGWGMAYTATNLPYGSLAAVYTQNPVERTSLAAARMFFGMPGILFIAVVTPMVVSKFDSERIGYPVSVVLYTVIAVCLIWLVFGTVRERVRPEKRELYSIKEMFALVYQNNALLLICVAVFLVGTANTIRVMMAKYYFDYNMKAPQLFPIFMAIVVLTMVIGAVLSAIMNKKTSKRNLYNLGMVFFVVGDLGIYFSPYSAVGTIMGFTAMAGFGSGIVYTLVWALVADTVEYGEWKTGKRAEGVTYASYSFFSKLSSAAGGGLGGFILAASGYVPHVVQTPTADHAIRGLFTLGPVISGTLAVVVMWFYKLDKKLFQEILRDLEARHSSSSDKKA
ncbi:MAG: MFS transporter [Proteobacteria bacterium]|nr:MFS transporter [Pseudomonadota bacterium]